MLTVNPFKRITAAEALKHPWICVRSFILILKFLAYFFLNTLSHILNAATRTCCISCTSTGDSGLPKEVQRKAQAKGNFNNTT